MKENVCPVMHGPEYQTMVGAALLTDYKLVDAAVKAVSVEADKQTVFEV